MSSTDAQGNAREFVTFVVAGSDYCIDISSVREIRGWSATTPLPHAPDYFMGVINLRGTVLPVIDLSRRLGHLSEEPTDRHAIIVLQMGERFVGVLVEAVADILAVDERSIEGVPQSATDRAKSFVSGIISLDERLVRVLGIDAIIPDTEGVAA